MPTKMELRAKARIKKGLTKYAEILRQDSQRGISEADTSTRVQAMLVDLLGYDRFEEITGEYETRGRYADWAVKVDDALYFFVEVKPLGAKLREKDLFQVVSYSHQPGLEWAVLTTAAVWQCHRIPGRGQTEEFFEVRILDDAQPRNDKVDHLYLLSKEGFSKGAIREEWQHAESFRPDRLVRLLLSDDVLRTVRRAVHRERPGRRLAIGELREALARGVIRGDLYEAAQDAGGKRAPKRKATQKRAARPKPSQPERTSSESGAEAETATATSAVSPHGSQG